MFAARPELWEAYDNARHAYSYRTLEEQITSARAISRAALDIRESHVDLHQTMLTQINDTVILQASDPNTQAMLLDVALLINEEM